MKAKLKRFIEEALAEDMGWGDVTTSSIFRGNEEGQAFAVAKADLVAAGLEVFRDVFLCLDEALSVTIRKEDGARVAKGEILAEIEGNLPHILQAERVALNILQRMCGIATETRRYVDAVARTKARILDTRKTLPGFRILDKYAVAVGGGRNHRHGLSDGVLIKDNHIDAAGSIGEAVKRCRQQISHLLKIEVECRNLQEIQEALQAGADVLLLDNMSLEEMSEAVEMVQGRAPLEASGNITIENVREIAEIGVDFISVGSLTHSVRAADISLLVRKNS
ncbi:MAG: carboxylating nicotinate-nucleotide diphosphorylase [Syntrophobacterales bacterium]|nr:carboxylating nicotinate-nucleotide diphosphorylase [Syntrophobacterales bacterium]